MHFCWEYTRWCDCFGDGTEAGIMQAVCVSGVERERESLHIDMSNSRVNVAHSACVSVCVCLNETESSVVNDSR